MRYCVYAFLLFSVSALWGQQHPVNTFPSIYTQRGIELYEEGRFNAAIAQFEEALKNAKEETKKIKFIQKTGCRK